MRIVLGTILIFFNWFAIQLNCNAQTQTDSLQKLNAFMESYKQGNRDYTSMPYIIAVARGLKRDTLADSLAQDYIANYILKQNKNELFTKRNLEFIREYTRSAGEPGFKFYYTHQRDIDSVMQFAGFSDEMLVGILYREKVYPLIKQAVKEGNKPDWEKYFAMIKKNYNVRYADQAVLEGKLMWYQKNKDWELYCSSIVEKVEKYGPYGFFPSVEWRYNSVAWDVFLYSNDKDKLNKALSWADKAIKLTNPPSAGYFDTYANLLYKIGRVNEAISWEEKAVALEPAAKDFQETLQRMKKKEPTWLNE